MSILLLYLLLILTLMDVQPWNTVLDQYSLILIDNLNSSKAAVPDGIHYKIIKECSEIFYFLLYYIFSSS